MFDHPITAQLKDVWAKARPDGPVTNRRILVELVRDFDGEATWGDASHDVMLALLEHDLSKAVLPLDAIEVELVFKGKSSSVTVDKARGVKATATAPKQPKPRKSEDGEDEGGDDDEDGAKAQVKLEFDMPFTDDVWVFLGRSLGDYVDVTLKKNQLDLPGINGRGAAPPKEASAGEKGACTCHGGPDGPHALWCPAYSGPGDDKGGVTLNEGGKKKQWSKSYRPRAKQAKGGKASKPGKAGKVGKKSNGTRAADDDRDEAQLADTPEEAEEIRAAARASNGHASGDRLAAAGGDDHLPF